MYLVASYNVVGTSWKYIVYFKSLSIVTRVEGFGNTEVFIVLEKPFVAFITAEFINLLVGGKSFQTNILLTKGNQLPDKKNFSQGVNFLGI